MALEKLNKNKEFLEKEYDSLLNLYRNKYILICDEKVVGSFDSYEAAADEGITNFGIDSGFLVQLLTESEPVNFIAIAKQ